MNGTDSILNKVRKLLRLAGNNPNPEEAASAAAMAQRLLDAHKLSAAMIDLESPAEASRGVPEEAVQDFHGAPLGEAGRDRARMMLASTIARANGCRIYFSGGGWGTTKRIYLVGRPSDAEAVRYLYAWVSGEMDRLAERHGRGMGQVWRTNFKLGIVDTIGRKLREQREAMAAEARASAASNPHALMIVSQALAQLETKNASVEKWMKSNMKLRAGRSSGGRSDGNAREAGRQAGESIRLQGGGRGLTSGAKELR